MPNGKITETTPSGTSATEAGGDKGKSVDLEAMVPVKIDGEEKMVTVREALAGYQRQSAFTQKTQELAAKEKAMAEKVAGYERIAAEQAGVKSIKDQLAELFVPKATSPLEDVEAFDKAWETDALSVIQHALKQGVVGRGKKDEELRSALGTLEKRLETVEAERKQAFDELDKRDKERAVRELESEIKREVPAYDNDRWVNITTRMLLNSDKPDDILGGKVGKEMAPLAVAKLVAQYREKEIEDRIVKRAKDEDARKKSVTLGNTVSSIPLPEPSAEIEGIKDPAKRAAAKLSFLDKHRPTT